MSLKNDLIAAVRAAMDATNRAAYELDRVTKMYMMTPEGIAEQRNKLFTEARGKADAAKQRGFAAIDAACATLDEQENAESARRAADVNYLARLEQKLNLAKGMGEIKQEDRPKLAELFKEFVGDPLSVTVIRNTLGADKAFYFLPNSNTGDRQQHLKTVVKKLFEKAMDKAGCNPASYSVNPAARQAECGAFIDYCNAQDEYFTLPDREVWQRIYDARPADGSAAAPEFDLRMMGL